MFSNTVSSVNNGAMSVASCLLKASLNPSTICSMFRRRRRILSGIHLPVAGAGQRTRVVECVFSQHLFAALVVQAYKPHDHFH